MSLTLFDMSDREFLAAARDSRRSDGYFSTADLAEYFDTGSINTHHVGSRLGYMARRDGPRAVEKHPEEMSRWCLTDLGEAIVDGSLSREQEMALRDLDPGEMIQVVNRLTSVFASRRVRDQRAGRMVAREFRRNSIRRNGR